ncbi:MAG: hypothetical protein LBM93_05580 [Oscillospiraceae bacterium]|jgi:hypothetical protein|nr:hypothetical protein [Oscillospiraceae bacterium]
MKISCSKPEIISKSIDFAVKINDEPAQSKVLGTLILFAEKFISDEIKLDEMRRRISMTKIAQMFVEEGIETGIKRGVTKGKVEDIIGMYHEGIELKIIARIVKMNIFEVQKIINEKS